MIFLGNVSGHDFIFHVQSWMDVAGQWREGILYPRWAEWANWGFGEPRFVFYPPLSWMAGAALGSALPWRMAPGGFIWLALVLAGMSMWRLARQWVAPRSAILTAALYAVNPYHLVIVYYRSAFGELLGAALLPLLIWAALRVTSGEWRRTPILSLAFAGIWLSNAPAAVIATYALGLLLIVLCAVRRSLWPLALGGGAMAGGFGLAAFYIVPAVWEQRWVQIAQAVTASYWPTANFLFTRANVPEYVAFNGKVSWVAAGLIGVTAIGWILGRERRREIAGAWWALSSLAAASVVMMLPVSAWLWRTLPKLWFVQFPWRCLDVVGVAFAFFVASGIASVRNRAAAGALAILVFAGIGAAGAAMVKDAPWDSSDLPGVAAAIHSGRGYEGADEYAPVGCDRYQFPGNPDDEERPADVSRDPAPSVAKVDPESDEIVPAAGVRIHPQTWTAERRTFAAESATTTTLAVRLVNYPAWSVEVNDSPAQFELRPETGQILVPLAAGSNRVDLRFRRTRDRALGDAISAISTVTLAAFAWVFGRKRTQTG